MIEALRSSVLGDGVGHLPLWRDRGFLRLVMLAMAGRRFWILPLLPLLWLAFYGVTELLSDQSSPILPENVQGTLMGVPLTALAVFLGIRIIAGEIEDRSLEIAYTVPGGCVRLWFAKLLAAVVILVAAELLLAAVILTFASFPLGALYGALQPACFYLVLAMAWSTLFRNEIAGAMATVLVLAFNGLVTDFGGDQVRISPFWNPHVINDADAMEIFAWSLQNRVGVALAMIALVSLAFMRANRRERMLAGG